MAPHNKRFPEQWEIISKRIDFLGLEVIDLGCGYGDMLAAIHTHGGWGVGVEQDPFIAEETRGRLDKIGVPGSTVLTTNIKTMWVDKEWSNSTWDMSICFSVLPYLEEPERALEWMANCSDRALLEVQYLGDGPGQMAGPFEMITVLQKYWKSALPIGFTTVSYRNVNRTIWLCE